MPRGSMLTRRRFVATTAAAGAWIAGQRRAQSQVVGKLTRMIVGFAPGGSSSRVGSWPSGWIVPSLVLQK
jgi:hypothetical protein